MSFAVAPVCARCRVAIPPSELRGPRARCVHCGPDVEVLYVAIGGSTTLVATFPEPSEPPPGMALERLPPPPPPPEVPAVGDGPFRVPGKLRVERRDNGALRIRVPYHSRSQLGLAATGFGAVAFLVAVGAPVVVPIFLMPASLALIAQWLRKKTWIEISAEHLWVHEDHHIALRIERSRITHIRCVCATPSGNGLPSMPWEVWVTVDGSPIPLVTARSLRHATAIAEVITRELGMPTWVPAAGLPAPRPW